MPPFLPRNRLNTASPQPSPSPPSKKTTAKSKSNPKRTLANALDSNIRPRRSASDTRKLISKIAGSVADEDDDEDDESPLSSPPSDSGEEEFQDVRPTKRVRLSVLEEKEESDDEVEFEDVEMEDTSLNDPLPPPQPKTMFNFDNADEDGESEHLDLTLTKDTTTVSITNPLDKKRAPSKIERAIRTSTHQMHVQFLLWHNTIRNAWCCDKEVKDILKKQVSPALEKEIERWRRASGLAVEDKVLTSPAVVKGKGKAKGSTKQKEAGRQSKDWGTQAQRQSTGQVDMSHGDPLFRLIKALTLYWKQRFRITEPGLRKIGYMPLHRLEAEMKSFQNDPHDPERHGERIADLEEFRARAKTCEGSRDLSAQLFTALIRSIGLEARLVVNLQPVGFGWSAGEEAVEKKEKVQDKLELQVNSEDDLSDLSDDGIATKKTTKTTATNRKKPTKPAANAKAKSSKKPVRKTSRANGAKEMPIDLSDDEPNDAESVDDDDSIIDVTPARQRREPNKSYEKDLAPNYWTEVLSPITKTYLPVSTLIPDTGAATNADLLTHFEPKGKKAEKAKQVMTYIIAHSTDSTAKDVTVRYLRKHMYPGKTKGNRITVEKIPIYGRHGKVKRYEQYDWFKTVISGYMRRTALRTEADDLEEATDLKVVKPERKEIKEGEETLASYKASKEYVLERHLKREEALLPHAKHIKTFTIKGKKGAEDEEDKVYLRKDVVSCKTQETWHKEGRRPKLDEVARKRVPYRVATLNRKRELAELERETGQVPLQGLYSIDQTELIIPPPIENGVIPKNAYGNIDLFTPEMCPAGAIHIPYKGMKKVCNLMGIDFAEAVTGFEFGGRMAIPIITGVVIAENHEEAALERWNQLEVERIRKEDLKKQALVLGVWRKMIMGLRIRKRVADEYGEDINGSVDESNPWTNRAREERLEEESRKRVAFEEDEHHGGGFFPEGHMDEEKTTGTTSAFFPIAHDSDEEDIAGGGFVVENHDDASQVAEKNNEISKPTTNPPPPLTFEFQQLAQSKESSQSESESSSPKVPSSTRKKTQTQKKGIAKSKTQPAKRVQTPKKRIATLPKKTKERVTSRRKVPTKLQSDTSSLEAEGSENDDDMSQLTDDDDDEVVDEEESEEESTLKNKKQPKRQIKKPLKANGNKKSAAIKDIATTSRGSRSTPRRHAARKSETALRSHYFGGGDDDDDGGKDGDDGDE